MTNRDLRMHAPRADDLKTPIGRFRRVAPRVAIFLILPLVVACGPLGDDDEPTQTPNSVNAPAATPNASPVSSPSAASPTAQGSRPISVTGGRGSPTAAATTSTTSPPAASSANRT